jgi:hypothetical protein
VPIWLLTSFSLSVVTTTGRLMVLIVHTLWRNPSGMATFKGVTSIMVAASWTLLAVHERRILHRRSTS